MKCHPSGISSGRKRDRRGRRERKTQRRGERNWDVCEMGKIEQEPESRGRSGGGVRKEPKFRHGNQGRAAACFPQEIHLNQVCVTRGENRGTHSTGQLGGQTTAML